MGSELFLRIKDGESSRLTLSEQLDIYALLCREANAILEEHQPCGIVDGKCRFRTNCYCGECSSLTAMGCSEKSLSCALWLCTEARKEFRECAYKLDDLYRIGVKCGLKME